MTNKFFRRMLLSATAIYPLVANATYNATVVGTVTTITQFGTALQLGPESVMFRVSNQPTIGCPQGSDFLISPATVTDAQTRKNMLAILLHAKSTGGQIQVAYDNTGGYCDQGYAAVYYIEELP